MEKIYVFKVSLKDRKRIWRKIEIKNTNTLSSFNKIIREAFNHDTYDHLSEFYIKKWPQGGFGEINPLGNGEGAKIKIKDINVNVGDTFGYVYDFGDEIHHIIKLEKIISSEKNINYPRIISQNKPKYVYCEECGNKNKKTVALYICIDCSYEKEREIYLCEDCYYNYHEEHYVEEILY